MSVTPGSTVKPGTCRRRDLGLDVGGVDDLAPRPHESSRSRRAARRRAARRRPRRDGRSCPRNRTLPRRQQVLVQHPRVVVADLGRRSRARRSRRSARTRRCGRARAAASPRRSTPTAGGGARTDRRRASGRPAGGADRRARPRRPCRAISVSANAMPDAPAPIDEVVGLDFPHDCEGYDSRWGRSLSTCVSGCSGGPNGTSPKADVRETCRLHGMFAAFRELGVEAEPVVYSDDARRRGSRAAARAGRRARLGEPDRTGARPLPARRAAPGGVGRRHVGERPSGRDPADGHEAGARRHGLDELERRDAPLRDARPASRRAARPARGRGRWC